MQKAAVEIVFAAAFVRIEVSSLMSCPAIEAWADRNPRRDTSNRRSNTTSRPAQTRRVSSGYSTNRGHATDGHN